LSESWFARPVLFVADVDRALDFYVTRLGFAQSWRYEEAGAAVVAQAERQGCALIFSSQWPGKVGKGLIFVSLDLDVAPDAKVAAQTTALDRLRAELEGRGVEVAEGFWGYRILIVRDPDGNELYFNYPNAE
jgi:uncharacterized glyoxalase superfamily protein PhnB